MAITFEVEGASLDQRSYIMGLIGITVVSWEKIESAGVKEDLFIVSIPEDQKYVLTDMLDVWHLRYRRIEDDASTQV